MKYKDIKIVVDQIIVDFMIRSESFILYDVTKVVRFYYKDNSISHSVIKDIFNKEKMFDRMSIDEDYHRKLITLNDKDKKIGPFYLYQCSNDYYNKNIDYPNAELFVPDYDNVPIFLSPG